MDKIEQEKLEELYVRLMSESQTISALLNAKDGAKSKELALVATQQVKTNKAFSSFVKSMKNNPENAHLSPFLFDIMSKTGTISKVIEKSIEDEPLTEKGED